MSITLRQTVLLTKFQVVVRSLEKKLTFHHLLAIFLTSTPVFALFSSLLLLKCGKICQIIWHFVWSRLRLVSIWKEKNTIDHSLSFTLNHLLASPKRTCFHLPASVKFKKESFASGVFTFSHFHLR